jgi:REP element-mobilizing transposase RayT
VDETNTQRLKREIVTLTDPQRTCIEEAVHETCKIRQWDLYAINARTNHVHSVVDIGARKPDIALNAFKANATRKMREGDCWRSEFSPWADKGSKRYLWNERSVARAIDYVLYGQGDDPPDFEE